LARSTKEIADEPSPIEATGTPHDYAAQSFMETSASAADRAMTCVIRRCLGRGHEAVFSVQ
jgi:hypothetical protein